MLYSIHISFHLWSKDFDFEMFDSSLTCGINTPNVLVVRRIGELRGTCWNKDRHQRWGCVNLWKKKLEHFLPSIFLNPKLLESPRIPKSVVIISPCHRWCWGSGCRPCYTQSWRSWRWRRTGRCRACSAPGWGGRRERGRRGAPCGSRCCRTHPGGKMCLNLVLM